jgi:RecB family endonuclease NucS
MVERPEMVERGLSIYRDPASGRVTGVGFETEVGEVDLLGVDESGALVVVMVCERTSGDPVAPVLERLGWVAKHVARPGQATRAVVLLEPPPPTLGYSARAVAETVAFKTYKVAVAVEDVEL